MTDDDRGSWSDDGTEAEPRRDDTTDASSDRSRDDDRTRELSTDEGETRTRRDATEARRTPFTQQVGRVIIFVAAILFGVFAVANVDSVTFNWIFGESRVPLILLLIVAFGFGALIAWLATIRNRRY